MACSVIWRQWRNYNPKYSVLRILCSLALALLAVCAQEHPVSQPGQLNPRCARTGEQCARRTINDWEELRVWEFVYRFRWKLQDAYRQLIAKVAGLDDDEPRSSSLSTTINRRWLCSWTLSCPTTHAVPSRSSVGFSTCLIVRFRSTLTTADCGPLEGEILTKKSATFANIEADQLILWKVN